MDLQVPPSPSLSLLQRRGNKVFSDTKLPRMEWQLQASSGIIEKGEERARKERRREAILRG